MTNPWHSQLLALNAEISETHHIVFKSTHTEKSGNAVYPLTQVSILQVSGLDAATFLQGQVTCNIHDITETQAGFGAFCNAKGRVLSSFIVLRNAKNFLIILPAELITPIRHHLQKYILRADVKLTDCATELCITGLQVHSLAHSLALPEGHLQCLTRDSLTLIRLEGKATRYIAIADTSHTTTFWSELTQHQFMPHDTSDWELLDIYDGIPWLSPQTSGEYTPQMLNLDKLGGISFNKGCYTGQEIVARTHYLGQAKRAMFIAQTELNQSPPPNAAIIDTANGQIVGSILCASVQLHLATLLVILSVSIDQPKNLVIDNQEHTPLTIL